MVNVNKLKGKIVEKGYSVAQVADGIGMNIHALYRRLKKPDEITIIEADTIAHFLELSVSEAMDIFFSQYVA